MKRLLLILKVLILFFMVPNYLYAYDFEVDGTNYDNGTRGGKDQCDWNYDAASNLWKAVDNGIVPSELSYYFAAGDDWHAIDYTEATHNGDTYELALPNELGKNQWQGQFHIDTGLTASAEKKYDFYLIMEADNNCPQVTFKLNDAGDTNYFVVERNDVVSGETFVFKRSGVTLKEGTDAEAIRLFFDFGGSPGGTNIKISKIYFGETANSNNNSSVFEVDGINYIVGENNTVAVTEGNTNCSDDVVIPSQVIYEGKTYSVTSIGSYAFDGCGLTSVTIPNSVISIGNGAFYGCYHLTSITIPGSVTSIGDHAFYDCISLTSVTIPNSVTSFGDGAFGMCNSLSTIVSEIAKPYVIDTSVFDFYSQDFRTLIVPKGTKAAYQATEGWNQFTNIVEAGGIEDVFEVNGIYYKIGENSTVAVTEGNTKYSGDVVIPSQVIYEGKTYNVTCIDIEAFSGCIGLTSVNIPNSVTIIYWRAFAGCSNLTSISIPKSLNYVVEDAFLRCDNLAAVYISDLEAFFNIFFDLGDYPSNPLYYAHHLFLDGEEIIDLVIPNGVTHIKQYALVNCSSLKSIYIPNSVTSIADGAFAGCSSLKSIVSEIENPFELNTFAFSDDTYANAILIVPKGTKVAYQAAEGWNHFTNIVEAGDDPTISGQCGDNVYYSYDKTTHTLTINGDGPMYSMDMEDYYPWWSFSNDIQHVKIESGVTSIGYSAFCRSGLTSITIPNSVTSIGGYAFNACYYLSSIISEIEYPFEIAKEVWGDLLYIRSDVQLIVPKGTKAAYQATEGWNQFTNIVEAGETEPDQPGQIHINDIIYKVIGSGEAEVVSVDNGETSITIPSTVSYNNTSYKVTAIAKDAFENCEHLAAVIWEPEVQFNAKVNNPNLLLYVNDDKYASHSVKNVVVDGIAESIELTDAASGNDFYCPRAFRTRSIVYSHNYQMETGIGDSRGWETIVLPFDVQKYTHATKGELESFTTWLKGSSKKPFWLFELTASGYKDVAGIKANTPYIISMPNNIQYEQQYQIPGIVTFSASDVEVQKSDNLTPASYQTRKFVPNYANKEGDDLLPLNVSNNYVTNPGKEINGSKFVRGLRAVHPFEAYMTTTDNTRTIDVMEGLSTAIKDIRIVENEASVIKVYDTKGVLLKTATSMDDARAGLKAGVYIVNGKKMIIK